jgi:ribosome-binding protein aMBF1 (putative translation factor)
MPPRRSVGSAYGSRYREFLRLLRAARRRAGLTQIDVARALNRPQSFVAKCESGERRIAVFIPRRDAGTRDRQAPRAR